MASGGYQRPTSPAPVSGPGALSQRTDGGPAQPVRQMTGGNYGDSQDLESLQHAAPMASAGTPQTLGQRVDAPQAGAALPTGLGAPTERPDEPVTTGNPTGPGAGAGGLTHGTFQQDSMKDVTMLKQRYLPSLLAAASSPDIPPSFVRFVRSLRDM